MKYSLIGLISWLQEGRYKGSSTPARPLAQNERASPFPPKIKLNPKMLKRFF